MFSTIRGLGVVFNDRFCSRCGGNFSTSNSNTTASSFGSLNLASTNRNGHRVSSGRDHCHVLSCFKHLGCSCRNGCLFSKMFHCSNCSSLLNGGQ